MSDNNQQDDIASSTFKILVATDNHLGYLEKDPVRGNDSFITFEEILQHAKRLEVDFVLLGGDLFHDNKPSRSTLYRTMELLRTYCFGDKPVNIEILSDQAINFATKFGTVNYEDPNFNIEIPIFSIHGNHDDPAGDGGLASLDLLAVTNLVNYFGKNDNIDDVTVYPILMRKGETKVAIYGMGNIRDERLYRTFQQKKVKLMRPIEAREEWFNIFVIHQNRYAHSPKNYVHEVMLDNFLDFVVWGHEHECLVTPQPSSVGKYYISQPGSSVATALSDGESKKKHIGVLEIYGDKFRMKPIALETVRPFYLEEIVLSAEEGLSPNDLDAVTELLASKVEEIIVKSDTETTNKLDMKPLIRLKVEYTGFSTINPQRFGQRFVGRVANPNELLLFHKRKVSAPQKPKDAKDKENVMKNLRPDPLDVVRVEDLIENFLGRDSDLKILLESDLHLALNKFVEKSEADAISKSVASILRATQDELKLNEDLTYSNDANELDPKKIEEIVMTKTAAKRAEEYKDKPKMDSMDVDMDNNDEGNMNPPKAAPKKSSKQHLSDDDEDARPSFAEEDEDEKPKAKGRPKKSAAAPKKSSKAAPKKSASTVKTPTRKNSKSSKYGELELTSDSNDYSARNDEDNDEVDEKPPKKLNASIKNEFDSDEESSSKAAPKRKINSVSDLLAAPTSFKKNKLSQLDEDDSESQSLNVSKSNWGTRKK
eukprot:TRINITY_DN9299_c0_g1_i2.p1 TRINITY_DN9299_c0_g1~~TRINITY_DN9299_c0_g1_i2.p1  ORF type:complete len:711 (-),score=296.00 TRINITY_DN9299_c0_g1_i2:56-2188(-)